MGLKFLLRNRTRDGLLAIDLTSVYIMVLLHSTRAKVNHVLSSREGKGGGDIDKVLGPPLRGGKRRSLGAKVNQRPIYST